MSSRFSKCNPVYFPGGPCASLGNLPFSICCPWQWQQQSSSVGSPALTNRQELYRHTLFNPAKPMGSSGQGLGPVSSSAVGKWQCSGVCYMHEAAVSCSPPWTLRGRGMAEGELHNCLGIPCVLPKSTYLFCCAGAWSYLLSFAAGTLDLSMPVWGLFSGPLTTWGLLQPHCQAVRPAVITHTK